LGVIICTYDVTFPLFAKIEVNGSEAIKWNFAKLLVNRDGQVLKRYAPSDTPEKIEDDLKKMLDLSAGDE